MTCSKLVRTSDCRSPTAGPTRYDTTDRTAVLFPNVRTATGEARIGAQNREEVEVKIGNRVRIMVRVENPTGTRLRPEAPQGGLTLGLK